MTCLLFERQLNIASFNEGKCCLQVSASLEEIFSQKEKPKNKGGRENHEDLNKLDIDSNDLNGTTLMKQNEQINSMCTSIRLNSESTEDEMNVEQSMATDSLPYREPARRNSANAPRRRSSLGSLVHFIKRNSFTAEASDRLCQSANNRVGSPTHGKVLGEIIQQFQFRSQSSTMK